MSIFKKIGAGLMAVGVIAVIGTFVSVKSANATAGRTIRLAHNQQDGTEIADTIAKFSEFVAEDPSKELSVQIYPSGILGSENEEIEMVQAGILDMAKVGSQTLSQFDDRYSIFAVPYLFVGQEHYYDAMEQSEEVRKLFESTADQGFIAIGYYANGSRNFYTVDDICVDDPSKLKGLKIRSMPSATSMEMITAMGGSPVPMSSSETYTALQQGVVDGAENTELALTVNGHEDLVKAYTYTEHQYSPDIFIISTDLWESMTAEQQEYLKECLAKTNDNFKTLYNGMMEAAIEEAQEHGVTIYRDIDKTALIESVSAIAEKYMSKGDNTGAFTKISRSMRMHSDKEDIMTKLINILNKVIEVVMVVLIVAMVCGNFWQIFTRFVLNNAASWTEEFLRYALIWLTMLGVPYAYSKNKHIAIEFVADTYSPKAKIVNQILIEVLVLFIAAFVMIGGGIMVTGNALGQTSPALGMPMQFYYLGVPVCGILLIIYTIPRLIGQIRALRNK